MQAESYIVVYLGSNDIFLSLNGEFVQKNYFVWEKI